MKNLTIRTKIFIVIIVITLILLSMGLFTYLTHKTSHCSADTPLAMKEKGEIVCVSCNADFGMHAENCTNVCPNRYEKNGICFAECSKDRPLRRKDGYCENCNYEKDVPAVNCSVCSNRYITDKGYCALKRCSDDKPLDDPINGCFLCNELDIVSAKNCYKCPNRYLKSMPWDNSISYCVLKECPLNAPLRQDDGHCYSCDSTKSLLVEDCDVCSNRVIKNGKCVLKECPADKPLRSNDGYCLSCGVLHGIKSDNCSVCSGRTLEGPFCVLKDCPNETPVRGINGRCDSCDAESSVRITEEKDCAICKNRRVIKEKNELYCALISCPSGQQLPDGSCTIRGRKAVQ